MSKVQILVASRPGLNSVIVEDTGDAARTRSLSNLGTVAFTGIPVGMMTAEMDGFASVYFIPYGFTISPAAAEMDGSSTFAITGRTGLVSPGAAEFDGVTNVAFPALLGVLGRALLDGTSDIGFVSNYGIAGAPQMDGAGSLTVSGGVGSAPAHMDGQTIPAFFGRISGGFDHGTAEMDGATKLIIPGLAVILSPVTAEMDGQGSMLGVQAGNPLPPHGIILSAGI